MNDVTDTMTAPNPLLEIDTGFASYLSAHTRSYKEHIVGGKMDYAFDADFSLRQKFNTFSGWNKLYKSLVSTEIPGKFKRIFQSASEAGSLQYPEAYSAAKVCAERLKIAIPQVFVRNAPEKMEIYSICCESVEPAIVLTSGLCDNCTPEELRFLIGCECGHIQNNHCIYYAAAPFFGVNTDGGAVSSEEGGSGRQLASAMLEWIGFSDVTADRAGLICCDKPMDYFNIIKGLREKGLNDIYARSGNVFDAERTMKMYETIHITPARSISLDSSWNMLERRIFAGMEFRGCEILYSWRPDIENAEVHTVNKQALEVRCEIILGADGEKGGAL